ncbi:MAG: GNAT family N-acetyltransferase [Alphaproteobacteria bacterium]
MPRPSSAPVTIRPARAHEAEALSAVAIKSKAHWGYDAAFMENCRAEIHVSPEEIEQLTVVVAQIGPEIAGFYSLEPNGTGGGELQKFFVQPDFIGHGVGRRLFEDMLQHANNAGFQEIFLDSDPYALGFYERMGCTVVGEAPSGSIPGRMLPRMRYPLGMITGDQCVEHTG